VPVSLAANTRVLFFCAAVLCGCGDFSDRTPGPSGISRSDGTVEIVDRTNKSWDVTHASAAYGLAASRFEFGLGPFAIRPILDPQMYSPGETGYPSDGLRERIIGVRLNGDARAYRLDHLARHEVVNEQFGEAHVAVAY
jgi:hypothetical protein